jgi:hypothetical protein
MDESKPRAKVAILLTSKPNFDEYAFKYFILSLNKCQSTYEFIFPEIDSYVFNSDWYKFKSLVEIFNKETNNIKFEGAPDYFINIIKSQIEENLFFRCEANVAFITTDVWEKLFSPPSLFEYLLHCISASLIFMHPKIGLGSHTETRGCTLDYTGYKMDDRVDISLGYLCDKCKKRILEGAGTNYMKDIEIIIGRNWIGDIDTFDSVAHNLKRFFKFDINKDSGFNKTFWEKAEEHFTEIPKEIIACLISSIIGGLVGAGIALFFSRLN